MLKYDSRFHFCGPHWEEQPIDGDPVTPSANGAAILRDGRILVEPYDPKLEIIKAIFTHVWSQTHRIMPAFNKNWFGDTFGWYADKHGWRHRDFPDYAVQHAPESTMRATWVVVKVKPV